MEKVSRALYRTFTFPELPFFPVVFSRQMFAVEMHTLHIEYIVGYFEDNKKTNMQVLAY